ncbi:hypothetical protein ACFV0R_22245 [Streptomyces sp. NPDC059578]|uniref:hypothetical protein n=1 Tax=Streptomyces sp. NPDC059578 TaxID=3346874 RepID=UPI0036A00071
MSEQPAPAPDTTPAAPVVRQQLEPAAADAVRAFAAKTRQDADRLAAVLEDIAAHGLPSVEQCTPWEDLREQHLGRLAAQRPTAA